MKPSLRKIVFIAFTLLPVMALCAEPASTTAVKAHKVVFEVSIDGPEQWEGVLRNVENVTSELGVDSTRVEVVAHGKGVGLLLEKTYADNPGMKANLEKLHAAGVVFAACENTMKRKKIGKSDLVALSTTVPSGVAAVIRRQEDGFSYIKSGG